MYEIFTVADQAWAMRGIPLANDHGAYIIDMGNAIGTKGGNNMICPRCDGQGEVIRMKSPQLNKNLFICNECDACWENFEDIRIETFTDFSTYLKKFNLDYEDVDAIRFED